MLAWREVERVVEARGELWRLVCLKNASLVRALIVGFRFLLQSVVLQENVTLAGT